MKKVTSMRDLIAQAIRGEPIAGEAEWVDLPEERRVEWRKDADRVMNALRNEMWYHFAEFSFNMGGVDWLAVDPDELWKGFFDECIKENGPIWPRED